MKQLNWSRGLARIWLACMFALWTAFFATAFFIQLSALKAFTGGDWLRIAILFTVPILGIWILALVAPRVVGWVLNGFEPTAPKESGAKAPPLKLKQEFRKMEEFRHVEPETV
ncbi:MAG: hypothetical protein QNJ35_13565 [Paracoccaceae bacterium]|nr:hypothetical protein [Paracoccaceae bacterium]